MVAGPSFKRWRNRGFFVAGNHDWGNLYGVEGLARIRNQEAMLEAFSKEGIRAGLYPPAGVPGPACDLYSDSATTTLLSDSPLAGIGPWRCQA